MKSNVITLLMYITSVLLLTGMAGLIFGLPEDIVYSFIYSGMLLGIVILFLGTFGLSLASRGT